MIHSRQQKLSLVVPVFNEEEAIRPFLDRTLPVLERAAALVSAETSLEIVFVNDGSTDATAAVLGALTQRDVRIKLVNLSRNFGKEAAVAAGLNYASGDAIIPIDVDLQDPPELIEPMVVKWLAGAKAVEAVRTDRMSDSWYKRVTANGFYRLYNRFAEQPIRENVGDFRLLDREVVEVLRSLSERSRFNKALYSWVGFARETVEFTRERRSAGTSKWKYWRLWNFALDGLTASTTAPLRVWTYLGAITAIAAFAYAAFIVIHTLVFGVDSPGYASLLTVVLFMGGLNMLALGIMGEYVGRIAKEVRGRPLYVVQSTLGF